MGIKRDIVRYDAPHVGQAVALLRSLHAPESAGPEAVSHPLPTAVTRAPFKLPCGRHEERDPKLLDEHPLLRRLFDLGTDEANDDLGHSLRGRQYQPVLVTGTECASPPDTTLDGRRRRRGLLKLGEPLQVEVLDGLTTEMEAAIIIHANIASGLARRYDERAKAALERYYIDAFGKRQGQRTDLDPTSVQMQGGDRRETPQLVADIIREEFGDDVNITATAVQERQLIFYDVIAPEALKQAVAEGMITRRPAADLVRKARRDPAVLAAVKAASQGAAPFEQIAGLPEVVAAKTKLITEIEKLLRKKTTPRQRVPKPTYADEATGVLVDGIAAVNYLGRQTLVEVGEGQVRLCNVGTADAEPNVYDPLSPTTTLTWAHDVAAAVDLLPGELRSQVTVGEPETLDSVRCPTCRGSRFYAAAGGCVRCQPIPFVDYGTLLSDAQLAAQFGPDWRDRSMQDRIGEHRDGLYRAAVEAAAAVDPRVRRSDRVHDLGHPRTRITLHTAGGALPIVFWECAADFDPMARVYPRSPAIEVRGLLVQLHRKEWHHSRDGLRHAVRRELLRLLGSPTAVTRTHTQVCGPPDDHEALLPESEPEVRTNQEETPKAAPTSPWESSRPAQDDAVETGKHESRWECGSCGNELRDADVVRHAPKYGPMCGGCFSLRKSEDLGDPGSPSVEVAEPRSKTPKSRVAATSRRWPAKTNAKKSCPVDVGALPIHDHRFARIAPRLLHLMAQYPREKGWSVIVIGRSLRLSPAALLVVARQLDVVLRVGGRQDDPQVRVRSGCGAEIAALEDRLRREVDRARRAAKANAAGSAGRAGRANKGATANQGRAGTSHQDRPR